MSDRRQQGSASLEALLVIAFLLIPAAALLAQAPQWVATAHATQIAANEAARAFVLADTPTDAIRAAETVAAAVLANHGQDPSDLLDVTSTGVFSRGETVTVTVTTRGHPVIVPGLGETGPDHTISRSATERIDDYRGFAP